MSKIRNAPGYTLSLRKKRLRIQWNDVLGGTTASGWHSPALTEAEKEALRANCASC